MFPLPQHCETLSRNEFALSPFGETHSQNGFTLSPLGETHFQSGFALSPLGETYFQSEFTLSPLGETHFQSGFTLSPFGETYFQNEFALSPLGETISEQENCQDTPFFIQKQRRIPMKIENMNGNIERTTYKNIHIHQNCPIPEILQILVQTNCKQIRKRATTHCTPIYPIPEILQIVGIPVVFTPTINQKEASICKPTPHRANLTLAL
jgi:hypothetical protein